MKPTKYKKKYCEELIEHMKQGFSYETFGGKVGVGKTTMYDWEHVHDEWKAAKAIAFSHRALRIEERLLESAIDTKDCNAALILVAKNVLSLRSEPVAQQSDSNVNLNITFAEASEDDRPED